MAQYQALYRQWRPRTFAEVVGQAHITRTLLNALRTGRLVHAYLFCGPRGTGKTSTAKILARAINCLDPREGEPCNECANCRRILAGNSLDVLEMDAASNRGIDEIRDLIEKIPLGPVEGRYKVYIIDEVHMLTPEAFNALLKTLEEPPAHAVFILATTEPRKVLPTILSRCQRFDFHPLTVKAIAGRLQEVAAANGVEIEPAALSLLSRKAAGGLRDALSLLDQILAGGGEGPITAHQVAVTLGTARLDTLLELTAALAAGDGGRVLHLVDAAIGTGMEPQRLLEDLLDHTRNLLLLKADPGAGDLTGLLPEEVEQVAAQARGFDHHRLLDLMERLQQGGAALRRSNQPRVILEMTLAGFLVAPGPSLEDLTRRVAELEERLAALEGSRPTGARDGGTARHGPGDRPGLDRSRRRVTGPRPAPTTSVVNAPGIIHTGPVDAGPGTARTDRMGAGPAETAATAEPGTGPHQGSGEPAPARGTLPSFSRPAPGAGEGGLGTGSATSAGNPAALPGLDLAAVQERWPEVLAAARRESIQLQAFLREGEPVALEGETLTLAVRIDFHRGMLEQPANREKVEAALAAVFGRPLKLIITSGKPSPRGDNDDTVARMVDFFGKDKVEIKD
ncbi:DNA polymerase III subunit gamma/tau [Moorella sp. Hama-1]|uniref:DNA polymerase III subunit gamma/tau n=1 Tax=Moorella sp. Hama-1 TaxID=2138101 RepID=UPI000D64E49C|nr:DNA polymerase III subunit gamma/tau [Moorella sp. Hama-1]MDN5362417.1 polymerase subunit gamma/tau [Moorella sp. (in: firmicutes)]BCV19973.1 DNA polymerase III, subunit gamma and tau [Moorella sp. Hama-1]